MCNEHAENEIKEVPAFAVASIRIKCLAINLTKVVNSPYAENYKVLLK